MKFYFGPLRKSSPLYDLKVYIDGAEILCPKKCAIKLAPKIRLADLAEEDLESFTVEGFSVKNEEELKLATDILSEKPIWITFSNFEFLKNMAEAFEISELTVILNAYYKIHKNINQKEIDNFIELHGPNALLEAAANQDVQLVNGLLKTTKYDINQKDEQTGVKLIILT